MFIKLNLIKTSEEVRINMDHVRDFSTEMPKEYNKTKFTCLTFSETSHVMVEQSQEEIEKLMKKEIEAPFRMLAKILEGWESA